MRIKIWLVTMAVLFIIGGYAKLSLFTTMITSSAFILLSAWLWSRNSLKGVIYRRRWKYQRGFPGEDTSVRIDVENRKLLPVPWLQTNDTWTLAITPENEEMLKPSHLSQQRMLVNRYHLRWFERVTRSFEMRFRKRGIYETGPVSMEAGDPFGIFKHTQEAEKRDILTIFPELLPIGDLHLPLNNSFGDRRSRRRLFEDSNLSIGIRDYHPEDDLRRVHWKATARSGKMQVKIFQPISSRLFLLCLNVTTTSQPWLGINSELLEQLVKISATLVYHAYETNYSVGLISNGYLARADRPFRIAPGRSPQQLAHLLQALAAVTPYTSAPFENYLYNSLPHLPYGAALTVVTGFVTSQLCEALLRLKRYRSHTTLISLETTPPPELVGIRTIHLPFELAL